MATELEVEMLLLVLEAKLEVDVVLTVEEVEELVVLTVDEVEELVEELVVDEVVAELLVVAGLQTSPSQPPHFKASATKL